jgi:hypothetical protein
LVITRFSTVGDADALLQAFNSDAEHKKKKKWKLLKSNKSVLLNKIISNKTVQKDDWI